MLVHRLRATHEAILVGRRTWELDQPSLTTRLWPGKSPKRFVLTTKTSNDAAQSTFISHLSALNDLQSLLVEGGAQTLQSFIDADLWDEAYIERSDIVLGSGIKAPEIKTDPKGRPIHVNFA
jgi:diaminohydroxyphosphoribosylaminopyrimidine deaminase/5-amino-6-(5-phosphoribosylamino)uracil reductase